MNDRDVVDALVVYLRKNGHPGLQVDRRPDEENRSSSDIDAIAGRFAIEHTSIDTVPHQRRNDDWFTRAAGILENDIGSALPFRLTMTLEYDAIHTGQKWDSVRVALRTWITHKAIDLPEGSSIVDNLPGVPFRLFVAKSNSQPPGLFFRRIRPDDETLVSRVEAAIQRKAAKLTIYEARGFTTLLLVESADMALMNAGNLLEAIRSAFPAGLPPGVDELWYADTSIPAELEFRDFTHDIEHPTG